MFVSDHSLVLLHVLHIGPSEDPLYSSDIDIPNAHLHLVYNSRLTAIMQVNLC